MPNPNEKLTNADIEPDDLAAGGVAPEPVPVPDSVPLPDPEAQEKIDEKSEPETAGEIFVPRETPHDLSAHVQQSAQTYLNFDPTIHATNADGSPKYKADGSYALKRGRKAGGQNSTLQSPAQEKVPDALPGVGTGASDTPAEAVKKVDFNQLGKVYAGLFFGATASVIGPEWLPADNDEKKRVETAFSVWAKANDASDLPPGWALVITLGMYSVARLQHQNTKSKFDKLKEKAFLIFQWAKYKVTK